MYPDDGGAAAQGAVEVEKRQREAARQVAGTGTLSAVAAAVAPGDVSSPVSLKTGQ